MSILTSRPPAPVPAPSRQDLMNAASPAVNVLTLLGTIVRFPDDSQSSISKAYDLLEEALECFNFPDYAVMAAPSARAYELVYDIAVKPIEAAAFVSFRVIFQVQP